MANVQIRDTSLWTKHIDGDPELKRKLEALGAGERVWLRVGGKLACFEKMRPGPNGPMPGLKPVDETRELWSQLYPSRKGQRVEIDLEETPPPGAPAASPVAGSRGQPEWAAASDEERDAAWEAFKALTRAGWRSDGAGGERDDLHEH
ncbi:MAG TPA: hypothetical protein VND93_04330 [Myxococcales bacterium]|nr:hypothetical protein [Myxococcales bacterium]